MKSLYTNKCLQRLYTPLTYEESLPYLNNWYVSNKTAFDKSVVCIKSISKDGIVNYVEKEMKTVKLIPTIKDSQGGETVPYKIITVNETGIDSKLKKGRLVFSNLNVILNNSSARPVQLWVDTKHQYNLTSKDESYAVIMKEWSPSCATNLGKYGTWDLEEIKNKT